MYSKQSWLPVIPQILYHAQYLAKQLQLAWGTIYKCTLLDDYFILKLYRIQ